MGQEISRSDFSGSDFRRYERRLREETRLVKKWFKNGAFEPTKGVCGFELESWLVDENYLPSPSNKPFLERIASPFVVAELSQFNFEINSAPHRVEGALLANLERDLSERWNSCEAAAKDINSKILTIGILPTIRDHMLTLEYMSPLRRFLALNQQVLSRRRGKPLEIKIDGRESLRVEHRDVMAEAAATSLQIHLQVSPSMAPRYYNAALVLSAPMVAAAANSPYLFGKDLWDETRIPTFEQAVSVASHRDPTGATIDRVTFGTGYVRKSILEPFLENLQRYPVLLPITTDDDPTRLAHLRLHNGTIWRWNRPIIGIGKSGRPHIRIECRVASAGPSIPDAIAHVALFVGLVSRFARAEVPPESRIPFEAARENFYRAAMHGLGAEIMWLDGKSDSVQSILLDWLLPEAEKGLLDCGVREADVSRCIDEILRPRFLSGRNGAAWQRAFIATHGYDFQAMTHAYAENQKRNIPVHEWTV